MPPVLNRNYSGYYQIKMALQKNEIKKKSEYIHLLHGGTNRPLMRRKLQLLMFLIGNKEGSSLFGATVKFFNLMNGKEKKRARGKKGVNSVMYHNKATLTSL